MAAKLQMAHIYMTYFIQIPVINYSIRLPVWSHVYWPLLFVFGIKQFFSCCKTGPDKGSIRKIIFIIPSKRSVVTNFELPQ